MIIRRVRWLTFRLPYRERFVTAHGIEEAREGVIVELGSDDGLVGLGEGSPVPAFGAGSVADTLRIVGGLAARFVGLDVRAADALLAAIDAHAPGASAAACALDTALCDLRARAAGVPVAALLGGDATRPVPVNATIGAAGVERAVASARRAVEAGFRCVKVKVGVAETRAAEVERVAALRDAIGPAPRLRLDVNGAWGVDEAVAVIRALERYDLELVEQPVTADDLDGLARVRAAVSVPIAADESVRGVEQAQRVIAAGAADLLVVKPMLAGGVRPGLRIVELAQAAGLGAFVTTTIDAGVGVVAALHLAAALPEPRLACGLATGPLLVGDLIDRPIAAEGGEMRFPGGAGLGVGLDGADIPPWTE